MSEQKHQHSAECPNPQDLVVQVSGRLAGLFVHEINNALATLREKAGLADDIIAAKKMADTEKLKDMEQVINSFDFLLNRAAALVRSFDAIGMNMASTDSSTNINLLFTSLAPFFEKIARQQQLSSKITIRTGLPQAAVRPLLLQCILVPLFENICRRSSPGKSIVTEARQEASSLVISFSIGEKGHEDTGALPWSVTDITMLAETSGVSVQYNEGDNGVAIVLPL